MRLKHIYVFDEDIDIHDDRQVDWAMGTRFQADQDLVVLQGMMGMTMDPSLKAGAPGPSRVSTAPSRSAATARFR